jgi:D-aminopeptidase
VTRARDLGISIGVGTPGPRNAITDVAGVRVGHATLVRGDGPRHVGEGPVRTGVTVLIPDPDVGTSPVFAGAHRLNGNGELTGLEWVRESGMLTTPIGLTNTHSVGVVRDALVAADVRRRGPREIYWSLPVVGETWDGMLNDINGMHVRPDHVDEALEAAGPEVAEGAVGGGTGMICHDFKGGIGTASRVVPHRGGDHVVGVLVQANHGRRARLTIEGRPVGRLLGAEEVPLPEDSLPDGAAASGSGVPGRGTSGAGSIIVIVATDAPLLPHQCERLAKRASFGIARTGGVGEMSSGDLLLCFATGNAGRLASYKVGEEPVHLPLEMLSDLVIDGLYDAVIEATEEAIVNALVAAPTMTGRDGVTVHAIPHDRLVEVMGDAAGGAGPARSPGT